MAAFDSFKALQLGLGAGSRGQDVSEGANPRATLSLIVHPYQKPLAAVWGLLRTSGAVKSAQDSSVQWALMGFGLHSVRVCLVLPSR